MLASKRDEVSSAKRRYDDGLEKVISTEEQVRWKLLERENMTRSRDIQRICLKKSAKDCRLTMDDGGTDQLSSEASNDEKWRLL